MQPQGWTLDYDATNSTTAPSLSSASLDSEQKKKQTQTQTPGKVLVYCESGNDRSAALVAAYIMEMYGLDLVRTIQLLQNQRFCVAFDDEMKALLGNYADLLAARRDVERGRGVESYHPSGTGFFGNDDGSSSFSGDGLANGASSFVVRASSKRRIEECSRDEDGDDVMGDGDDDGAGAGASGSSSRGGNLDAARFERRAGFAPFIEGLGG